MKIIYVPCHTHCSPEGYYNGFTPLGVAFPTREQAVQYLREHRQDNETASGADESIIELKLEE